MPYLREGFDPLPPRSFVHLLDGTTGDAKDLALVEPPKMRRGPYAKSTVNKQRAREMFEKGADSREIAQEIGVTRSCAQGYMRDFKRELQEC